MNSHENIEFWLIGDGPLWDHYRTKIEEQDLSKMVHLKGNQDHILSLDEYDEYPNDYFT